MKLLDQFEKKDNNNDLSKKSQTKTDFTKYYNNPKYNLRHFRRAQ